jgi:serine/threonine protein kinase
LCCVLIFLFPKPGGNILITPEGVVKLADFGASKKLQDIRTFANSNAPGTMTGTP